MKVVTVNIPENYLKAIEKIKKKEDALYPSRSELIRSAVREFLKREIKKARNFAKSKTSEHSDEPFDDENYVRVPIDPEEENDDNLSRFKTYKIIKKLI